MNYSDVKTDKLLLFIIHVLLCHKKRYINCINNGQLKHILRHNRRSYESWYMLFWNRSTRIINCRNTFCQFCPFSGIWYCFLIFDCGFVRLNLYCNQIGFSVSLHLTFEDYCYALHRLEKNRQNLIKRLSTFRSLFRIKWPHNMNVTHEIPKLTILMWFPPNKAHCTIGKNHQFWSS